MSLKSAALLALIGMLLLTVLAALTFIRDITALSSGAVALDTAVASTVRLFASLTVAIFFFVFHRAQA
jgi:hypothetical protein